MMSRHLLRVEEPIHQLTGLRTALFRELWMFRAKKTRLAAEEAKSRDARLRDALATLGEKMRALHRS
jgi:hypothetical protein